MGQQFFLDKAVRIRFVPDCSLAPAAASKMEIALLLLLSLGVQCVIGNPLSEEKRWGHAASNSGASNGNNIVLGKKKEEEKRGGQAATNSWSYPQGCSTKSSPSDAVKKTVVDAVRLYSFGSDMAKYVHSNTGGSRQVIVVPENGWTSYGSNGILKCVNYKGHEVFILY